MQTVGAFEAKTHLSRLLELVAQGETITITRHGRPVAKLVPVENAEHTGVRKSVQDMLAWRDREGPKLGKDLTIRQLVEEGRR